MKKLLAVPAYKDAKSVCLYLSLPTEVQHLLLLLLLLLLSQLADRTCYCQIQFPIVGGHWGACTWSSPEEEEVLCAQVEHPRPLLHKK